MAPETLCASVKGLQFEAERLFRQFLDSFDRQRDRTAAAGLGSPEAFLNLVCSVATITRESLPDLIEAVVDTLSAKQIHATPYSISLQALCHIALTLGGCLHTHPVRGALQSPDTQDAAERQLLHYVRTAAPGWQVRETAAVLLHEAHQRRFGPLARVCFFGNGKVQRTHRVRVALLELGQDRGAVAKRDTFWKLSPSDDPMNNVKRGSIAHFASELFRPALWSEGWAPVRPPMCINAPCYEAWRAAHLGLSRDECDASRMGSEEVLPAVRQTRYRRQVRDARESTVAQTALAAAQVVAEGQVLFVVHAGCRYTGETAVVLAQATMVRGGTDRLCCELDFNAHSYDKEAIAYKPKSGGGSMSLSSLALQGTQLDPETARCHRKLKVE